MEALTQVGTQVGQSVAKDDVTFHSVSERCDADNASGIFVRDWMDGCLSSCSNAQQNRSFRSISVCVEFVLAHVIGTDFQQTYPTRREHLLFDTFLVRV